MPGAFDDCRRELIACICLAVLLALIALIPALTVGIILDRVIQTHAFATLLAVLLAYGLFFVCELVFTFIQDRLMLHVTHSAVVQAEARFWRVLADAPYASLERLRDDDGLARFLSIGADVRFRADWAISVASIPLCMTIAVVALYLVSAHLMLMVLTLTGAYLILRLGLTRAHRQAAGDLQRTRERELAQAEELLQGALSLRAHRAFDFGLARWLASKGEVEQALQRWSMASVVQSLLGLTFERLTLGVLLGVGAYEVIQGLLSVGQLVMANMLLRQVSAQVRQVAPLLQRRHAFLASQEKMASFLLSRHPRGKPGAVLTGMPDAAIVVKDLCFQSPDGRVILDRISFEVPANKSLVILGASGAGKTTLLKILSGLYPPATGCVLIHGILPACRSDLAYLSQHEHMFAGSIADNVLLGRTSETLAGHGFDQRDLGRLIPFAHQGPDACAQLSGGERQRLFVARALASGQVGLFLDEPSTALDASRSVELAQLLSTVAVCGPIVVIATHDAELARIADYTLHLDGAGAARFAAREGDPSPAMVPL